MKLSTFTLSAALLGSAALMATAQACSSTGDTGAQSSSGHGGSASTSGAGGDGTISVGSGGGCPSTCAADGRTVVDCDGKPIETCMGLEACDLSTGKCANACQAAINNKRSVGCEYYATFMDQYNQDVCFAVFVANTWDTPAHLNVDYDGATLPVQSFTRIPSGAGAAITYQPYDANAGLPPGEVAVLFLSGPQGVADPKLELALCPIDSAIPSGVVLFHQTGIGRSFHITSDVPVVSYEMNPYGGGSAATSGASLLLPTSVWDLNYITVNASPYSIRNPSMNIVAMADGTHVTLLPIADVEGGPGIPAGPANAPLMITLDRGQHAQLSQKADLTGSVLSSDKPVGFMAGQQCMNMPMGVGYCDHGEQMVPPIKALGDEYVGVMYRPRMDEKAIWHVIGAVDGTTLTWSSNVGGPSTLDQGQVAEFVTSEPFVVKSQDKDHPFMLFTYMSGSQWQQNLAAGYGDPDFVISIPPKQYMSDVVFFADPSYPETNLVVVRARDDKGQLHDVSLDCAGTLGGWTPVGAYEWTRVDLGTGDFQPVGNCSTGRHEMKSDGRFGLWVWGWGTPLTSIYTKNVSYGYPAGMNVQPINQIVVPPTPK